MSDFRPAKSLALAHDTCEGCDSATVEQTTLPNVPLVLCGRAEVQRAFGRARISAAVAHAEFCAGRYHPRYPKETTR